MAGVSVGSRAALIGAGAGLAYVLMRQFVYRDSFSERDFEKLASTTFTEPSADDSSSPEAFVFEPWASCVPKARGDAASQSWRGSFFDTLDCGDDSFFITRKALGIADGVGGWRRYGVDPTKFPNLLMKSAQEVSLGSTPAPVSRKDSPFPSANSLDPVAVLDAAYTRAMESNAAVVGTSTATIALLDGSPSTPRLNVANLGDSGAAIIRDGTVFWRSIEQQHRWNCPYQMGQLPRGVSGFNDPAHAAITSSIPLKEDDVVVLGTDGLFDNLYDSEIADILSRIRSTASVPPPPKGVLFNSSVMRTYFSETSSIDVITAMLVDKAFARSKSTEATPFAECARLAGLSHTGGKEDDITVVVAKVVRRANVGKVLK